MFIHLSLVHLQMRCFRR